LRPKFVVRFPIEQSVHGGRCEDSGRSIHRSKYVVFGLFAAPDPDIDGKLTVVVGGPKRFRPDMMVALRAFKQRDIYQLPVWGNREKWAVAKVTVARWAAGLEKLRGLGWTFTEVRGFRRLMG